MVICILHVLSLHLHIIIFLKLQHLHNSSLDASAAVEGVEAVVTSVNPSLMFMLMFLIVFALFSKEKLAWHFPSSKALQH